MADPYTAARKWLEVEGSGVIKLMKQIIKKADTDVLR